MSGIAPELEALYKHALEKGRCLFEIADYHGLRISNVILTSVVRPDAPRDLVEAWVAYKRACNVYEAALLAASPEEA